MPASAGSAATSTTARDNVRPMRYPLMIDGRPGFLGRGSPLNTKPRLPIAGANGACSCRWVAGTMHLQPTARGEVSHGLAGLTRSTDHWAGSGVGPSQRAVPHRERRLGV